MNVDADKINVIVSYLSQAGATRICLFGSYARGDQSPESDLDLLVSFARVPSLLTLIRMERELSERLDVKVDLITENSVDKSLLPFIKQDEKVLYAERWNLAFRR